MRYGHCVGESFRPPFSKGGAVEDAESSSPSADGEILYRRFLFAKLFLCAYMVKEKAAKGCALFGAMSLLFAIYGKGLRLFPVAVFTV